MRRIFFIFYFDTNKIQNAQFLAPDMELYERVGWEGGEGGGGGGGARIKCSI